MAFVSTSLLGYLHLSHSHYFILFLPFCSYVVSTSMAGVWIALIETSEGDWERLKVNHAENIICSAFFFSTLLVKKIMLLADFDTWGKQFKWGRERRWIVLREQRAEMNRRQRTIYMNLIFVLFLQGPGDHFWFLVWFSGAAHWSFLY